MIKIEKDSEIDINFTREAEQFAMRKVVNIYRAPYFRHSFVRFGPLSSHQDSPLKPKSEEINPTVDRLKSIFQYGLISHIFAKRIQVGHSRNFSDIDLVCLAKPDESFAQDFGFAINANVDFGDSIRISAEDIFVLLISQNIHTQEDEKDGFGRQKKFRVSQKDFRGIIILDDQAKKEPPIGIPCQPKIDWDNLTLLNSVAAVAQEMLGAYYPRAELAIPVYGYSGSLYWPELMDYHQVQEFTRNRGGYE